MIEEEAECPISEDSVLLVETRVLLLFSPFAFFFTSASTSSPTD